MAWKMHEQPKTTLAKPALVKEFADMEPAPYDRPLSEKRMMVYERILNAGEFRTVTWAAAWCKETNCVYRVNGKHTATLLSRRNPLPDFHVTVERYMCDTLKDVANLYNTFDSNLASRTTKDINLAFAAAIPELKGLGAVVIHLTVSACASQKWDENELKRVPPAERAEELLENTDFAAWLSKLLFNGQKEKGSRDFNSKGSLVKPLRRAPVASAMLATYHKGPRIAADFWEAVRDETASSREDATRVLARWLIRASLAGGGQDGRGVGKRLTTNREVYAKCVHAWNAWRKGEATNLAYHATAPLPEPIR